MSNRKPTRKEKFQNPPVKQKQSIETNTKTISSYYIWIVGVIGLLLYANTLNFGYTLDDYSLILENKSTLKGFGAIKEIFSTSYRYGYIFLSDELYRPISKAIFAIQWGLAPNKPFLGHLTNIVFFAFTCMVMYRFLAKNIANTNLALVITLLFAAMPIHTEVVASIKSLDEILALLFGLLAMEGFVNYASEEKYSQLIKASFYYLLALLSKESSVTLLAVFPIAIYFFVGKMGKSILQPSLISLGIVLMYLAVRAKVLGGASLSLSPSSVDNMLVIAPDLLARYTTAIGILGLYLLKMIVPSNLSFDNSFPQIPFMNSSDITFIISLIVLLAMLIFSIISIKKRDLAGFGFLFFFITASVSSNIFVMIGTHWGERLMYLPSFGIVFSLIVLFHRNVIEKLKIDPMVFVGIFGVLFFVYGGVTIARNNVWKNNYTLYSSGLVSAPNSTRVNYYMGNYLIKEDVLANKTPAEQDSILKLGIRYLETATKLVPSFTDAWNQQGLAQLRMKNYDKAILIYKKAIQTNPNDPTVHSNLGTVYFSTQKYKEALDEFNVAVRLKPDYSEAWTNLGSTYGTFQQFDLAISAFEKSLAIDPSNAQTNYFLGITWQSKGNAMLAKQYLDRAEMLRNNPLK
jgi:tetratricopeptide (TPR) repeat protein